MLRARRSAGSNLGTNIDSLLKATQNIASPVVVDAPTLVRERGCHPSRGQKSSPFDIASSAADPPRLLTRPPSARALRSSMAWFDRNDAGSAAMVTHRHSSTPCGGRNEEERQEQQVLSKHALRLLDVQRGCCCRMLCAKTVHERIGPCKLIALRYHLRSWRPESELQQLFSTTDQAVGRHTQSAAW